ncbi:hypothetical protein P7K49_031140 [Saguinus oedipus]|uniref:Uncharacterized protein n=1 Tax=Saguinus oedipus TaxID=9490 RepID=A0ABQ9U4B1_SAGOE|nr:hypothetical protein P7K49_031140 [Saguinus oedipus]
MPKCFSPWPTILSNLSCDICTNTGCKLPSEQACEPSGILAVAAVPSHFCILALRNGWLNFCIKGVEEQIRSFFQNMFIEQFPGLEYTANKHKALDDRWQLKRSQLLEMQDKPSKTDTDSSNQEKGSTMSSPEIDEEIEKMKGFGEYPTISSILILLT